MPKKVKRTLARRLNSYTGIAVFCASVYILGLVVGGLGSSALDSYQRGALTSHVDLFIRGLRNYGSQVPNIEVAKLALLGHLKVAVLVWLLGISVIGAPVIVLILFVRGFAAGFTAGFLTAEMGGQGILLATFATLPHSVFAVPALFLVCVSALGFGLSVLRQSLQHRKIAFLQYVLSYSVAGIVAFCVFLLAAFVEAYITPVFIRILAARLV